MVTRMGARSLARYEFPIGQGLNRVRGTDFDQTPASQGSTGPASAKCGLGRSREPQRRLAEIGRRHLINELHDAVLPSAPDFQEIRVVFT